MADLVAALDQGTTSTRCMVFDHDGREVARAQLEPEQILPRSGRVEHDPDEIGERTRTVAKKALRRAEADPSDLAAVGVTNQRETTVVGDRRTGRPCLDAVVWQDTRTHRIAAALERDGHADLVRERSVLPPATYFAGGKLKWIIDEVDGVREAAEAGHLMFGTMDTWLRWKLTGGTEAVPT